MYASLLSVLLMGMLPMASAPSLDQIALEHLSIAPPLPAMTGSSSSMLSLNERMTASGVLVMDLESGQSVYGLHADAPRPMGSLTKLMTALLVAENHDMNEVVTVPQGIQETPGNVAHLLPGEQYTVGNLLTALLVVSANDAAETLALFHGGTEEAFVAEMNERAKVLGLRGTSFANPAGFDDPKQWSTPRDLAWLASFDLRFPQIRSRLSLPGAVIRSTSGRVIGLENTHALLREGGSVVAGKTGTTEAAGQCLLSVVREGKRRYVVVLLGSRERYADMRAVLSVLAALFV